jgi:hypothetical protein
VHKLKELVERGTDEELKRLVAEDDLLQNLPDVENFDEEIKYEIKRIEYKEAEAKIKELKRLTTEAENNREKKRESERKNSVSDMVQRFGSKLQRRASDARSSAEREGPSGKPAEMRTAPAEGGSPEEDRYTGRTEDTGGDIALDTASLPGVVDGAELKSLGGS